MLLGVGFCPNEALVLVLQVEIFFEEWRALVDQVRVDFDVPFQV
jgi:hypothetical protein